MYINKGLLMCNAGSADLIFLQWKCQQEADERQMFNFSSPVATAKCIWKAHGGPVSTCYYSVALKVRIIV
jgi:hypothetical protein